MHSKGHAYLKDVCTVLKREGVAGVVEQAHNVAGHLGVREKIKIWEDLVKLIEGREIFQH